jgi:hypothetical protein
MFCSWNVLQGNWPWRSKALAVHSRRWDDCAHRIRRFCSESKSAAATATALKFRFPVLQCFWVSTQFQHRIDAMAGATTERKWAHAQLLKDGKRLWIPIVAWTPSVSENRSQVVLGVIQYLGALAYTTWQSEALPLFILLCNPLQSLRLPAQLLCSPTATTRLARAAVKPDTDPLCKDIDTDAHGQVAIYGQICNVDAAILLGLYSVAAASSNLLAETVLKQHLLAKQYPWLMHHGSCNCRAAHPKRGSGPLLQQCTAKAAAGVLAERCTPEVCCSSSGLLLLPSLRHLAQNASLPLELRLFALVNLAHLIVLDWLSCISMQLLLLCVS